MCLFLSPFEKSLNGYKNIKNELNSLKEQLRKNKGGNWRKKMCLCVSQFGTLEQMRYNVTSRWPSTMHAFLCTLQKVSSVNNVHPLRTFTQYSITIRVCNVICNTNIPFIHQTCRLLFNRFQIFFPSFFPYGYF